MRGMTRFYHERFFADVRGTTVVLSALFVVGWGWVPEAFTLVPVVALLGAVATAFDASYLVFARHYAARLERRLDPDGSVLVAASLEDTYLFPLDRRKVVVAAFGSGFSWFGFVTLFVTALGAAGFVAGLVLAIPVLSTHSDAWLEVYVAVLGGATVAALAAGVWWFVAGVGERRLATILDRAFP